jgi:SPP1 gp7 family putative phage head morphogenesis protein
VTQEVEIEPKSLIHYVNNRKFQNAFGRSDLRAAYQAWFTKRHIVRYYSIFLEKAASPTPIARFDRSVPDATITKVFNISVPDATITKVFNIIKKFQSRTAMTVPKEVEIDFLESKTNGEAFIKGINIFNMFIGRSLTIPDLVGLQGSDTGGGSQALSREQMKVFANHIKRRRFLLESIVNKHIIEPLVVYNFGDIDNHPIFQFRPLSDEDAMEYGRLFLEATRGNVYKPSDEEINHFRSLIKFPEGEVEHKAPAPSPFQPDPAPQPSPSGESEPSEGDEEIEIEETEEPETEKESFAMNEDLNAMDKGDGGFNDVEGPYKEKVDFKTLNGRIDGAISSIMTETKPLIADMVESVIDQIQKKKILEKKDLERVNSIKFKNLKPLQISLKKNLRSLFGDGQKIAMNELFGKNNFQQPLLPEEFLAVIEAETFNAIGDWEYNFRKDLQIAMQKALKDGTPISSVIAEVEGEAANKLNTSIERFARTKTTEVLNNARLAVYDDSDDVVGYQYSAVLDSRTTELCAGLHGKKFKKGNEPVPPLHFNCRSMLIPITKFEPFEEDKSVGGTVETKRAGDIKIPKNSVGEHIRKNIGKGFSTK